MTLRLNPTEQRVVDLIVHCNLTYHMAAQKLGWSRHTVRFYVRQIADRIPGDTPPLRKLMTEFANAA